MTSYGPVIILHRAYNLRSGASFFSNDNPVRYPKLYSLQNSTTLRSCFLPIQN